MKKKNGKKRIIFMAPTPPPYMGPSVATEVVLKSQFVKEFYVIQIDTSDRRPLSTLGKIDFINIYLAFKHYIILFGKLLLSRANLIYILISQTRIGFLKDIPFILLAKAFRKKIVLHLRGGYFRQFYDSSGRLMKGLIRKTLKKIDRMIVLGDSLKHLFDGLIPQEKISVVPNGLNLSFDEFNTKKSPENTLNVLFLSNLQITKGFWDVLYRANKVIQSYPNVRYIFAGAWRNENDRLKCQEFLIKEKIIDHVEFLGTVFGTEKLCLLKEADIFVFPTYYPMEGHPWVIIEAMAAGLPIIATDKGCIREAVIDGENGFIIPQKDPDAIAEKIIYLIEHPELRKKMGERSQKLYETHFTEKHFIQKLIETMYLALR